MTFIFIMRTRGVDDILYKIHKHTPIIVVHGKCSLT